MRCISILLFLAVVVSSPTDFLTTATRHGAHSVDEKHVQQDTTLSDKNIREIEDLPHLDIHRRDVSVDSRTDDGDATNTTKSRGFPHQSFPRSSANGRPSRRVSNITKDQSKNTTKDHNKTDRIPDEDHSTNDDGPTVCEHRLYSSSGTLSSLQMEESVTCRWNISVSDSFIVTVVLAVLRYHDSSLALEDSAGDSCLQSGSRIVFTEFLSNHSVMTAFCEVKSAQIAALTFTTLSNMVSIDVYNRRGSQIVWAVWYQAVEESSIKEAASNLMGDFGSENDFMKLSAVTADVMGSVSNKSKDHCFNINGSTISPRQGAFETNETCSLALVPDVNQELMLSFPNIGFSDAFDANCSSEDSFITVRTWKPDTSFEESVLCSNLLMGEEFRSPVRIELNYYPSAFSSHDFTAEMSIILPDMDEGGADLLRMFLKNTMVYALTDEQGHFASLGYPAHFPSMRMIFEITVNRGNAINLEILDVDLGYTPPSTCNASTPFLIFILSPLQDKQHVYCGNLPPRNITSSGSKMVIIFDPKTGSGRGIQAVYKAFKDEKNTSIEHMEIDDIWNLLQELPILPSMIAVAATVFDKCEYIFMMEPWNNTTFNNTVEDQLNSTTCWQILSGPSNFIKNFFTNVTLLDSVEGYDGNRKRDTYTTPFATSNGKEGVEFRGNFGIDNTTTVFPGTAFAVKSPPEPAYNVTPSSIPTYKMTSYSVPDHDVTPPFEPARNATPFSEPVENVTFSPEPDVILPTKSGNDSSDFADCNNNIVTIFTSDSGIFATKNYPNNYPANYSSCWYIVTEPTRFVRIRFRNFSLDSTLVDPCDKGYSFVTIYDFVIEPVILCGTLEDYIFKSSSNRLKIKMEGRLGRGHGFYATYDSVKVPLFRSHVTTGNSGNCDATSHLESLIMSGIVGLPAVMSRCAIAGNWMEWYTKSVMENGWFASPLFPGQYPARSQCTWVIRADGNTTVNLNFLKFDLGEVQTTYPPCDDTHDFILIRDCVSGVEKILCGIKIENYELLQSNSVEIEFYGGSGYGSGFHAFYSFQNSNDKGQEFRELPNESSTVQTDKRILNTTITEQSPSKPHTSTLLTTLDKVTIDYRCKDLGSDECGGSLQSEFGYISYSLMAEETQTKPSCTWTITSSLRDHEIALKILDIGLGTLLMNGTCDPRYGHLNIVTSTTTSICSNKGRNLFVSDGGMITVEFAQGSILGRGFCAAFISIGPFFNDSFDDLQFPCLCENVTKGSITTESVETTGALTCEFLIGEGSGTIPSDNFPIPYPPNFECVWTFLADPGEYVNLQIRSFDLDRYRGSRRCLLSDTHVQITIFEEDQVLNKRFCSDDDWSVPIPSSQDMTVKFISGDIPQHNHTGFQMAYNFSLKAPEQNTSANESTYNFGFRVFDDYDDYSSYSSYSEEPEPDRKSTDERPRLTWPVEMETDVPDFGLFTDFATDIPDVFGTELPDELRVTTGYQETEGDISTTASGGRPVRTNPTVVIWAGTSTTASPEVVPGKGAMTAREMELTIYICTALAAILIVVLILVTLYCAKNRGNNSKAGFEVDAEDEANYWQTYKDWAKDWKTEPVAPSAQSTVGAMCGDGSEMAADGHPLPPGHLQTVSAVVSQPPINKPERTFIPSEKLV